MPRPFLTAEWRNLFLATYAVPPSLLAPRLPPGLELDTRGGDAFVSLVAFEFLDTRVFGVRWPGYRDFPELNLRAYVRHGGERGVLFLREFVPLRLVVWLARAIYNEPYRTAPLTSRRQDTTDGREMEYRVHLAGREHVLRVEGRGPAFLPDEGSDEHFFKEHYWGFGRTRRGQAIRYAVHHPPWEVFPVRSFRVDLDWESVYGPEWAAMNKATPVSTVFAVGSAVEVFPKGELIGKP